MVVIFFFAMLRNAGSAPRGAVRGHSEPVVQGGERAIEPWVVIATENAPHSLQRGGPRGLLCSPRGFLHVASAPRRVRLLRGLRRLHCRPRRVRLFRSLRRLLDK